MSDSEYVLVLRTCDQDHRSYGGFQWPELGPVECPDWNPSPVCGGGLHGLLWGAGDWTLVDISPDAVWKVARVLASEIVDLGGKVKFPRGEVVYSGTRDGATGYIVANGGTNKGCHWATLTGGYRSTLTGGYRSVLTGGHRSVLTGGDESVLTGGHRSVLTGGDESTLTGGHRSVLTGGDESVLTGGDESVLTGGHRSTLTGGDESVISAYWWDTDARKMRRVVGLIGQDGLRPGIPYRLEKGEWIEATEDTANV